jgi:hypothetical protein
MDYKISFGDIRSDEMWRECYCDKYFDAVELFNLLTKKYLHVWLSQHKITESGEKRYIIINKYSNQ